MEINTASEYGLEIKLKVLKQSFELYEPLWEKWISSKDCFLTRQEIEIVNAYVINKLRCDFSYLDNNPVTPESDQILWLNQKLKKEYQKYKEWVILDFLFSIIEMAGKEKGKYLRSPINELDMPDLQKQNLNSLGINTLEEFFEKYTEEDLSNEFVFEKITAFMVHKNKMI